MSEIGKLTETLNLFMQATAKSSTDNAKVITRLEVNQVHLTTAVKDMSVAAMTAIESNTRLESKIESLEERALDRLNLVEDSANDCRTEVLSLNKRTNDIETRMKVNSEWKDRIWGNWFKLFMVLVMLLPVTVSVYNLVNDNKTPTTKASK